MARSAPRGQRARSLPSTHRPVLSSCRTLVLRFGPNPPDSPVDSRRYDARCCCGTLAARESLWCDRAWDNSGQARCVTASEQQVATDSVTKTATRALATIIVQSSSAPNPCWRPRLLSAVAPISSKLREVNGGEGRGLRIAEAGDFLGCVGPLGLGAARMRSGAPARGRLDVQRVRGTRV